MNQRKTKKLSTFCLIYLAVIVACVVVDQLTKFLVYDTLLRGGHGKSIKIIGTFLQFAPVLNRGAAFGMGNSQASDIVFFIVTVVGIPAFCYLLLRSRTRSLMSQIAFAIIIGGTIGNAIDRGFYATEGTFFSGGVRDFISFSIFPPVFNVADFCLTMGVFMAIASIVYFDPDSLVKLLQEENAQKVAPQTADTTVQNDTTDAQIDTDTVTTDDTTIVSTDVLVTTNDVTLPTDAEVPANENDTTD